MLIYYGSSHSLYTMVRKGVGMPFGPLIRLGKLLGRSGVYIWLMRKLLGGATRMQLILELLVACQRPGYKFTDTRIYARGGRVKLQDKGSNNKCNLNQSSHIHSRIITSCYWSVDFAFPYMMIRHATRRSRPLPASPIYKRAVISPTQGWWGWFLTSLLVRLLTPPLRHYP